MNEEDPMARFGGKVILISGGARGQGAAEARMLVAEGAKVVIGDVLEDEGRRLAAGLGQAAAAVGGGAKGGAGAVPETGGRRLGGGLGRGAPVFVRHDVTQEAEWARAVATA